MCDVHRRVIFIRHRKVNSTITVYLMYALDENSVWLSIVDDIAEKKITGLASVHANSSNGKQCSFTDLYVLNCYSFRGWFI